MKKKTIENHIYHGLGFPIKLHRVEMEKVGGDWHPKIDVREVADQAIIRLGLQEAHLTDNEIKFIRNYFSLSIEDFTRELR